MKLKNPPRSEGKVVPVTPKFLIKKEAMQYVGMGRTTFDRIVIEKGLSIYAYQRNKIWYKIAELDEMIESFRIKSRT